MDPEKLVELAHVLAWLDAGEAADYQAGVLLLQQHSRNRNLVGQLLKKESPANREKLMYELLKLFTNGDLAQISELQNHIAQAVRGAVPSPDVPTPPAAPTAPAPLDEQPAPDQVPDALRPEVDDLTELMSKLYRERVQLSNSLADLDSAEGPRVVGEILRLEQQYNTLAEKRRCVLAGQQPAALEVPAPAAADEVAPTEQAAALTEAAPAVDRAALLQQRGNLRSNLSKTRGKLDKAQTEAKRSELSQKLAKLEVELDQVELQLKQPQA